MRRWTLVLLLVVAFGVSVGCPREEPVTPPPGDLPTAEEPADEPADEPVDAVTPAEPVNP